MTAPSDRVVVDASRLPTVVTGARDVNWWGTIGFMVVEGTTLAACAVSYIYLSRRADRWPPEPAALPDPIVPAAGLLLLLAILLPMSWAARAALRLDAARVRAALSAAVLMTAGAVVLRWWEFRALHVRWDTDAYGSAAWTTLGFHTLLLVVDLFETGTLAAIFYRRHVEPKHFSDVTDAALYQWFLSLTYIPLYVLLFLSPRWT